LEAKAKTNFRYRNSKFRSGKWPTSVVKQKVAECLKLLDSALIFQRSDCNAQYHGGTCETIVQSRLCKLCYHLHWKASVYSLMYYMYECVCGAGSAAPPPPPHIPADSSIIRRLCIGLLIPLWLIRYVSHSYLEGVILMLREGRGGGMKEYPCKAVPSRLLYK
jgi:hypothetical protein